MRYPTLVDSLSAIRAIAPASTLSVIDIGVQRKTDFLMQVFPDVMHFLFEPVSAYHQDLKENYGRLGINYELFPVGLTDQDGDLYLHNTSADGSGKVTHSHVLADPNTKMPFLLDIERIEARRLDSVDFGDRLHDLGYIVKLDVDGVEEKIVQGGASTISAASFVVIEASLGRQDLFSRASMLEELGFRLFDICDHAYYFDQLALVDMVFINKRLRAGNFKFRPWEYSAGKVVWQNWQHGFGDLTAGPRSDPYKV